MHGETVRKAMFCVCSGGEITLQVSSQKPRNLGKRGWKGRQQTFEF
jgi:hypothetical protein